MFKRFVTPLSVSTVSVATIIVFLLSGIPAAAAEAPRTTGISASIAKDQQERGSTPFRSAVDRYYGRVRTGLTGKIIGGTIARWPDHQWQAALLVSWIADPANAQFCGGSLIYEEKWVVTAAHCTYDYYGVPLKKEDVHVLTGTADLSSGGKRSNVEAIYRHEEYNDETHDNDIALLKLKEIGKGKSITPITEKNEPSIVVSNKNAMITGWGITESGSPSPQLKQVDVPLVDRKKCNGPASYDGAITDNMICAGRDVGGKDSCQGDSGGPNTRDGFLIGIVSWGEGCGQPFKYGVYTRVSQYAGWIEKKVCTNDPESCRPKK